MSDLVRDLWIALTGGRRWAIELALQHYPQGAVDGMMPAMVDELLQERYPQ